MIQMMPFWLRNSQKCDISIQEGSELELEPEFESDSKELEDFLMNDDPTPLTPKIPQNPKWVAGT
jgi:hypothetical protein